jgi:hypothetical protein
MICFIRELWVRGVSLGLSGSSLSFGCCNAVPQAERLKGPNSLFAAREACLRARRQWALEAMRKHLFWAFVSFREPWLFLAYRQLSYPCLPHQSLRVSGSLPRSSFLYKDTVILHYGPPEPPNLTFIISKYPLSKGHIDRP